MRTFYFKSRVIGQERYLTYTMGEESDLNEDVLDYCEENKPVELIDIIFEEDDDYDYLTYDITGRVSLADYVRQDMKCETVLNLIRNVAGSLISLKEQTIHLNYILLNKSFMYVNDDLEIKFMCVPVEIKGSIATEFKGFVREFLANLTYDVDENLDYVGKLLTYINGDNFNLRGLIGLSEALMEEEGLDFEEAGDIDAGGVEVVTADEPDTHADNGGLASFMNSSDGADEPLPEIGDDEEEGEAEPDASGEIESILPEGFKQMTEESKEEAEAPKAEAEAPKAEAEAPKAEAEAPKAEAEAPKAEAEAPKAEAEAPKVEAEAPKAEAEAPKAEAEAPKAEAEAPKTVAKTLQSNAPTGKETDVDIIKNRLKAIVGADTTAKEDNKIKSIEDLDSMLNRPPSVKKNVVKVNRAALIQSAVAHEEEEGEVAAIPVASGETPATIEEAHEDSNDENENKPTSNSVLSKNVETTTNPFTVIRINPYLIRVNTEERIMINKPIFKLGKSARGVDYTVGGNGAISRQHAIIIQKDGVCYIRDNKSTNHTYVNDVMVEEGVDEILTHDSVIRLGDEEFKFKIR